MTYLRISTDHTRGRINGYMGEGNFTDDAFDMTGGIAATGVPRQLYQDLPGRLASRVFSTVFHTPIHKAHRGDSSSVRGAAWLWRG